MAARRNKKHQKVNFKHSILENRGFITYIYIYGAYPGAHQSNINKKKVRTAYIYIYGAYPRRTSTSSHKTCFRLCQGSGRRSAGMALFPKPRQVFPRCSAHTRRTSKHAPKSSSGAGAHPLPAHTPPAHIIKTTHTWNPPKAGAQPRRTTFPDYALEGLFRQAAVYIYIYIHLYYAIFNLSVSTTFVY